MYKICILPMAGIN